MPKTRKSTKTRAPAKSRVRPSAKSDDKALTLLQAKLHRAEVARDAALESLAEKSESVVPGYEDLAGILKEALNQASRGKGKERHANDLPFNRQKMMGISDLYHGPQGMLWQATKKATEANEMLSRDPSSREFFEKELLGAIVYISGAIVYARMKAAE